MTDISSSKKKCATCGKLYKVCFTCESEKAKGHEFWRATACSPECYQVHLVLSNYYYKFISKEEAEEYLKRLLEDRMLPYSDNSRKLIEEIMKEELLEQTEKCSDIPVANSLVSESTYQEDSEEEPDNIASDYVAQYED